MQTHHRTPLVPYRSVLLTFLVALYGFVGTPDPAHCGPVRIDAASLEYTGDPPQYGRFVARGEHRTLSAEDREAFFVRFARQAPQELAKLWRHVGAEIPLRAGVVAAPHFEELALDQLAHLGPDAELGLFLGKGVHEPQSGRVRKLRRRAVQALAEDPALVSNFTRIHDAWLHRLLVETAQEGLLYTTPRELVEVKILIARNLYFSASPVTEETVRREFRTIAALRQRFSQLPVFAQREVLMLASSERWRGGGGAVFGGGSARRRVARQANHLMAVGGDLPIVSKETVLEHLAEGSAETVIFSGHGRPRALRYDGGLKVGELARSLVRASAAAPEAGRTPLIVLILACRGHDFARNLLETFDRLAPELPKPVLVTPEEYGQPWVKPARASEVPTPRDTLSPLTLGELSRQWGVGASVLVPADDNSPHQIF